MASTSLNNGILRRILGPDARNLRPEVAGFFLGISLTETDNERIATLSEKANEGTLNPQERDELGLYILVTDFIAIMQSNARASLKNHSPAA